MRRLSLLIGAVVCLAWFQQAAPAATFSGNAYVKIDDPSGGLSSSNRIKAER